jgi:hypothetical protein
MNWIIICFAWLLVSLIAARMIGRFFDAVDGRYNKMMENERKKNGDTRNTNFIGGGNRNSNLFVQRLENTGL